MGERLVSGRAPPQPTARKRHSMSRSGRTKAVVRQSRRLVCIIHTMQSRELISYCRRMVGSSSVPAVVTINLYIRPSPERSPCRIQKKDLGKGLVQAIRKQAGLK